jgi:hypothetical protein
VKISVEDFEEILDLKLSAEAKKIVNEKNFEYEFADPQEHRLGLMKFVNFLTEYKKESGPEYQELWEKGWQENLDAFISSGELRDLIPKFVRKKELIRFNGKWISPVNAEFETNFVMVLRDAIFRQNFDESSSIWEFGSGTGLNLVHLSKIFPDKKLFGCDWAIPSVQILVELNKKLNLDIQGFQFDLFNPNREFLGKISENSGLFTIGTMEQLGQNYQAILDFILASNFKRIVHIETNYELYDENNFLDYLAKKYIVKRNWLRGYFSALRGLEKNGKIRIIQERKTFGSFYHDGYSVTVWENLNV